MNKIFIKATIFLVKIYKYFFSPLLGNKCRFLPSCSDYFIECLNEYGLFKGILFGFKRIIKCHPFKFLGGSSGLDLVPKKRNIKNG
jgi:putative membrane protein insertion efficiency factor|tara:strand:+ start:37 stop:294 length:258 start_codon:yes stop_codon:yes gene_type:complete